MVVGRRQLQDVIVVGDEIHAKLFAPGDYQGSDSAPRRDRWRGGQCRQVFISPAGIVVKQWMNVAGVGYVIDILKIGDVESSHPHAIARGATRQSSQILILPVRAGGVEGLVNVPVRRHVVDVDGGRARSKGHQLGRGAAQWTASNRGQV